MSKRAPIGALLLLLAGAAQAELQIAEQTLSFTEVATGGHRIAYATIEVPEGAASALKGADLRFTAACLEALGELTLVAATLWAELPPNWELATDPTHGMTGLFFPAEGENAFHAEIGKLLMDWTGPQSAILVLAFECGDIDCDCSPLIVAGELRLATLATGGQ
ncbi:hypothetical protein FJ251_13050 [bacterium]|nr:hypothetical protein [bacterium]